VVSIDKIVILFTIAAGTWMDAGGGDVISCHVAAAYSRQIEPPRPTRFALLVWWRCCSCCRCRVMMVILQWCHWTHVTHHGSSVA